MLYYIILFFLLLLSVRYDINGKTKYSKEWYFIILIIFIIIPGLRFRLGEDTINYLFYFYHATPDIRDINGDTLLASGQPPLWLLLNSIVKTFGGRFFVVQLIHAAIVNTLIFKYFKKHSPYPFACVALFFFWRYFFFNMVIMKAAIALSIILFANDYFLEKKYIKGFLLIIIATGFHQSSILLVITPFITFLRFNKFGIAILVFAFLFGIYLQRQLGDVFALMEFSDGISNKLDDYMDSKYMTQEHNMNYFIAKQFPAPFYSIISLIYLKTKHKEDHILRFEPFLMFGLIFLMLQFNIQIFYRYIYIYIVYFIFFIVHFFFEWTKDSFKLKSSLAYARTFMVILPFVVLIARYNSMASVNYYPYSSVVEKSISKAREKYFASFVAHYNLNMDEY